MKTQENRTFELTITLNAKEANYLKQVMQNCMCAPEDEPEEEREIRESFFKGLPEFNKLQKILADEND